MDGIDGEAQASCRSCAAPSSASTSSTFRSPRAVRDKTLWLWRPGPGEADLERCFRAYLRRFNIEHAVRFVKGILGWTTPQLCSPPRPTVGPGSSLPRIPSSD